MCRTSSVSEICFLAILDLFEIAEDEVDRVLANGR